MKRIKRNPRDCGKQKFDVPSVEDFSEIISENCIVEDESGRRLIVYLQMEGITLDALSQRLVNLKYEKSARTSGLPTVSRVFGYQPRIAIRRDFCTAASLNTQDWQTYYAIRNGAELATQQYSLWNPALFRLHMDMAENVHAWWRMDPEIPFTSGIVNRNNQLRYHRDQGNFKGVWSAMYVFRKDCDGGYLSCPEFDIGFELKNNSLLMFDGQSILHGVTPFTLRSPTANRISIVYYSLAGMWKCLPPAQELARIRKVKTAREKKRVTV